MAVFRLKEHLFRNQVSQVDVIKDTEHFFSAYLDLTNERSQAKMS
ncbi:hypothetical protein SynA1524_00393 [Synechococcus sp. A15-24]|nr:hypothetical protein SynA1524_00393 [Synechococcus sp. A15-24]